MSISRENPIGALLRQPRIRRPDGSEGLFDELIGRGFAVVGRRHGDCALGEEAAGIFEKLGGRCIPLEDVALIEGEANDAIFETSPAVLVRPDRFVFGFVDEAHDLDALVRALAEKLALR